jgi:hypothetical protein
MEEHPIRNPGESDRDLLARAMGGLNLQSNPGPAPPMRDHWVEKKSAVLPKPPVFDGNKEQFLVWKLKMKAKIRHDGATIGQEERARVDYIFAFLEGEAAIYVEHHYKKLGDSVTVDSIWKYLDERYDDPHRA